MAYERCLGVVPEENILIITLGKFKDIINEQIPELPKENLLLEPYARRTAPCIAYATYTLLKRNPDAVMAATLTDIIVNDEQLFKETMTHALDYAEKNPVLVTLGVKPDRPDTEYGYIQAVGGKGACSSGDPVKVKTFTEKPDAEIADVFFRSGEFFWNSGIFVWQASVIKEEMERYIPEITRLFDGWEGALGSPAEEVFIERAYTDCIKLSIDYGVMEKNRQGLGISYPVRLVRHRQLGELLFQHPEQRPGRKHLQHADEDSPERQTEYHPHQEQEQTPDDKRFGGLPGGRYRRCPSDLSA